VTELNLCDEPLPGSTETDPNCVAQTSSRTRLSNQLEPDVIPPVSSPSPEPSLAPLPKKRPTRGTKAAAKTCVIRSDTEEEEPIDLEPKLKKQARASAPREDLRQGPISHTKKPIDRSQDRSSAASLPSNKHVTSLTAADRSLKAPKTHEQGVSPSEAPKTESDISRKRKREVPSATLIELSDSDFEAEPKPLPKTKRTAVPARQTRLPKQAKPPASSPTPSLINTKATQKGPGESSGARASASTRSKHATRADIDDLRSVLVDEDEDEPIRPEKRKKNNGNTALKADPKDKDNPVSTTKAPHSRD